MKFFTCSRSHEFYTERRTLGINRHLTARGCCALLAVIAIHFGSQAVAAASAVHSSNDISIADFNGSRYSAGWRTTGNAFGSGPAHGAFPKQNPVLGYEGSGLVNSFSNGDSSTGTLTSPPFKIRRKYLSFFIGGGNYRDAESLKLYIGGRQVESATGNNSEQLDPQQWDLSRLTGQTAYLVITDSATAGWGHILVDDIRESNLSCFDPSVLIRRAMSAMKLAIPVASADPGRPTFHFHAPAQWMNDPNGLIYYDGWYHTFYQCNPYGSQWGNMHWGHARSRDMVNWQYLPIALWPSKDKGEGHVFSGSIYRDSSGRPVALYTSISSLTQPRDPEVWAAQPLDDNMIKWQKYAGDPVITEHTSAPQRIEQWRDPFVVKDHGVVYLITGGEIDGRGAVIEYEASGPSLASWSYCGPLFYYPDSSAPNIECPNLVKDGRRWILLISVKGHVEYFTGAADLRARSFNIKQHGILNDGSYASQAIYDRGGDCVEVAWIASVSGPGWHGCLTAPSVMTVGTDWSLHCQPISAFDTLRGPPERFRGSQLNGAKSVIAPAAGNSWEMDLSVDTGSASTLFFKLPVSKDGKSTVTAVFRSSSRTLSIPGLRNMTVPVGAAPKILQMRIYLDRSLIDIYSSDGGANETGAYTATESSRSSPFVLTSAGGSAVVKSACVYRMRAAETDLSLFN